ncbi:MAG TPA: SDR family oxidoreductase [Chthoniobacteraceae bacterium]|nr:SDR family oxidoreductase [Chthoniobacteraceae bacterium]
MKPETILVTGANRGIGLALAQELASHGNRVFAACRKSESAAELRALEAKHPGLFSVVKLDVDSDASVADAAKAVAAQIPSLDVLVNNAAVFPEEGDESIMEMDLAYFRAAFETNVLGVIRVTRAFLPLLEKSKNPRVVNISSGAGSISDKTDHGYYAYSASKAALNMVTRAMAAEFKPRGITFAAISPGWVKTEMGGPNAPLTPEQSAHSLAATIAKLTIKQTSTFLNRDGGTHEYDW